MRSSYNKSAGSGPPTSLNTKSPGETALEKRVQTLEKLVTYQDEAIRELQSKTKELFPELTPAGGSDASSEESTSQA